MAAFLVVSLTRLMSWEVDGCLRRLMSRGRNMRKVFTGSIVELMPDCCCLQVCCGANVRLTSG